MEERIVKFRKRGKLKANLLTVEALALRRIRIFKKITRQVAGEALGFSERSIERLENGRSKLTEEKKSKLLKRYKVSHEEFRDIVNGKTLIPELPAHSVHPKIGKGNYVRRFDTKKITKEVRLLKSLRDMRGLSQSEVGRMCGVHAKSIGHIEHGRVDLTDVRLSMLLKAFKITKVEFEEMLDEDLLRYEVIGQCTQILKTIEQSKLKAVQALLINF